MNDLPEMAGKRLWVKGFNPFPNLLPPTFYQPKAILLALGLLSCAAHAQHPQATLDAKHRAFFKDNCLNCHNAEKQKGKVRLDDIAFSVDSVEKADLWQKVLNSINSGEMPPEDEKQPDPTAKTDFLDDLSRMLVTARAVLSDNRGKITMRRLNRREYKNTIRDLLGVDLRVNELPADGGAGTFDTVGASLFMSSDQFEQYLALGRQALDEHFARFIGSSNSIPQKKHVEPETFANKQVGNWAESLRKNYERLQQWIAAVDAAAALPENAARVQEIRARPEVKANAFNFHRLWAKQNLEPSPTKFAFKDFDDAAFAKSQYEGHYRYFADYLALPAKESGAYLTIYDVHDIEVMQVPSSWPVGNYTLRVRIAALDDASAGRRFLEVGQRGAETSNFTVLSAHQITGTMAEPQILEIPVEITTTSKREFTLREKVPNLRDAHHQIWQEAVTKTGTGPKPALWIDWLEIEGPAGGSATPKTAIAARSQKLRKDPEQWANKYMPIYAQGYEEKYGRFQKWCAGIDEAAKRPENADIVRKLRDDAKVKQSPHLFYSRFAEIAGAPPPAQFGFRDVDDAQFARSEFTYHHQYYLDYAKLPQRETGAWLMLYSLGRYTGITAPANWPAGKYTLRVRLAASDESPKERRFIEIGTGKADAADFNVLSSHQVTGTLANPQTLEIPVEINASGDRNFAIRDKRPNTREAEYAMFREAWDKTGTGPRPCIWVDFVELEGPVIASALAPQAASKRIEPETRRVEVERGHLRYKYLNEQYAKWKAAGGDEAKLKDFGFTDKSHAEFAKAVWDGNNRWFQQYLDWPLSKTGLYLDNTVQETCEYAVDLPADIATGDYVMRVKVGRVPDMPSERAFLTFVEASPIDKDDRTFLANKQITATLDKPEVIELPFKIVPGGPRKFVLFEKRPLKKETISLPGRTRQIADAKQRDPVLWIDWIEYEGPVAPANAQTSVSPVIAAGETNARQVLETFAKRAFRGKTPSAAFLDKLVALHETRLKAGESFDNAIREPLSVVLASPGFLYLQETGPQSFTPNLSSKEEAGKKLGVKDERQRSLSPPELASRLSYFLWSAPPDESLLQADLSKPEVIAREVDRMIASPKADEFVSGFVHQWLGMDRLDFFQFDTKQFRDFDESAKAAARREVYETFAHLLRHNGSLTNLLKSDEIHVNGLLATYYGIEGISGDAFQKVKLPAGSPRGGLLGMAAILAMGSNGERTSPVERGAWVLRKLLHNPPPPAPPNVPQITRLENKLLNTRERLLAHQEEPQCLQCHRKIDFIGFGLENFNAAGKWRTEETYEKRGVGKKTWPIDPSGQFYNGPAFQDYFQLRDLIADKSEDFARGFTEALIEYALGRPYGFTDAALADDIVKHAKANNFAVKAFFVALASSKEFRSK